MEVLFYNIFKYIFKYTIHFYIIMNVVLVCLHNFQEYILTNIEQLLRLNHKNIYVITNFNLFNYFYEYKNKINLINADELNETYNFYLKSSLDKIYRDGFWILSSLRFFYIYEFMQKNNVDNVIHIENDVLLYYNCDVLSNILNKNFVYIPFDTYNRNIASIMYIPNLNVFKNILDNYNFDKNDMDNFCHIKKTTQLIQNFPIFKKEYAENDEQIFVSENSEFFPYIFDAAAIGQYLGGIDPIHTLKNTSGFINETCVIKYNIFKIIFKEVDNIKKPFIIIKENEIPIFNLHIHSKNLKEFI